MCEGPNSIAGYQPTFFELLFSPRNSVVESQEFDHTACMRAPLAVDPLTSATALPLPILASDFCLLTTNWEDPKASEAWRFSEDMMLMVTGVLRRTRVS